MTIREGISKLKRDKARCSIEKDAGLVWMKCASAKAVTAEMDPSETSRVEPTTKRKVRRRKVWPWERGL